jgi:hypothetical protein
VLLFEGLAVELESFGLIDDANLVVFVRKKLLF